MCLLPSTSLLLQLFTLDSCSCLFMLKCTALSSQVGSIPHPKVGGPLTEGSTAAQCRQHSQKYQQDTVVAGQQRLLHVS